MPEPTKTDCAPSCITSDASAGRGDAAGTEERHGQLAALSDVLHEVERSAKLLRSGRELHPGQALEALDRTVDVAQVADGLDDVAGAGLALGTDEHRTLGDPAQGLTEVGGAADERDLEGVLVDVVGVIGRSEDLGLVDEVDLERLEDLRLGEVADADLRHHGDRDDLLDAADHRRDRSCEPRHRRGGCPTARARAP